MATTRFFLTPLCVAALFAGCAAPGDATAPDAVGSTELAAKASKVDVCHFSGTSGAFHIINVSANAVPAHIANHGDHLAGTVYADADGDGWGDPASAAYGCLNGGLVDVGDDCDDADDTISPDGAEVCDSVDNDCDGATDDADGDLDLSTASTWYADDDADGFGDAGSSTLACAAPAGFVADDSDCDDSDAGSSPAAAEACGDAVDNDCDGLVDEDCAAADSCAAIQAADPTAPSAMYTIDPLGDGNLVDAWCDMDTDGGGWTRIFGIENVGNTATPVNGTTLHAGLAAAAASTGHVQPSDLNAWENTGAFSELRFECEKTTINASTNPEPGRKVHIQTSDPAVLDYFTGDLAGFPVAPGSFSALPDDASVLSGFTSAVQQGGPGVGSVRSGAQDWGRAHGAYFSGRWGHDGVQQSSALLYNHSFFIGWTAHWIVDIADIYECDDMDRSRISREGYWYIWAR